jgi:hypothetical protein
VSQGKSAAPRSQAVLWKTILRLRTLPARSTDQQQGLDALHYAFLTAFNYSHGLRTWLYAERHHHRESGASRHVKPLFFTDFRDGLKDCDIYQSN